MKFSVTKKKIFLGILSAVFIIGLLYVLLPQPPHLIEIGGTSWEIYPSEYYGVSGYAISSLPAPEEENKLFLWIDQTGPFQPAKLGLFVLKYVNAELAEDAENQLIENMKLLHNSEWEENTFGINGYDAFGIFRLTRPQAEAVVRKSETLYFVALNAGGYLGDVKKSMSAILSDLLENGMPA